MIHPYFNLTGEEAKGLLYGLLEVNKQQLRTDPSMPSMRKLIAEGRVRYRQADPNEHWQSYREIVDQVRQGGVGYADCEDLAPAVAAEDQVRENVGSLPYAYKPREGLFHVVVARPQDRLRFSGSSFPPGVGAPPLRGFRTEDPSAAAGMTSDAVFGGVRGKSASTARFSGVGKGLGGLLGSFTRGVTGGKVQATSVAEELGKQARQRAGIEDDFAKQLGSSLLGGGRGGGRDADPDAEDDDSDLEGEDDDLLDEEDESFGRRSGGGGGGIAGNIGTMIMRSFLDASVGVATQGGFDALAKAAGSERRLARAVRRYDETGDKSEIEKIRKLAERIQGRQVDWDEVEKIIADIPDEDDGDDDDGDDEEHMGFTLLDHRPKGAREVTSFGARVTRSGLSVIAESLRREIRDTPPGRKRLDLERRLADFEVELADHVEGSELPFPTEAYLPEEESETSSWEDEEDDEIIGEELLAEMGDEEDYGANLLLPSHPVSALSRLVREPIELLPEQVTDEEAEDIAEAVVAEHFGRHRHPRSTTNRSVRQLNRPVVSVDVDSRHRSPATYGGGLFDDLDDWLEDEF